MGEQKSLDECTLYPSNLMLAQLSGVRERMFAPLNSETSRQSRMLAASLALHGLIFAWLLHAPEPQLLMPSSVAIGHNGKVVARLYFPAQAPDDSSTSSSDSATQVYRHQRQGHEKLVW